MQNKSIWKTLALVSTLCAIGLCIYLSLHHFSLQYAQQGTKSFCSVNSAFDCDSVNISSYSKLLGIPIALWGAFAFIIQFLFLIGALILAEDEKPRASRMYFYFSLVNVFFCFYLGGVSTLVLKTICLFCGMIYVLCALILLSAYKLKSPEKITPKVVMDDLKSWTSIILILIIPAGSFFANASMKDGISKDLDVLIDRAVEDWSQSKKYDFYVPGAPSVGPDNAKFKLVVFSDFQCPFCKNAAPSLHAFANAHKNEVQLIYQNYPLDTSCNPKGGPHKYACKMAKASICAHEQGKFLQAHDWIFSQQSNLSDSTINDLAKELKLDETKYNVCLNAISTDKTLNEQIKRGDMGDVKGTPTVFANGKLLPYGFLIPILEKALKAGD